MSKFLLILGLGFELGGIATAIWGLADVRDEFFKELQFPHQALLRRVRRAFGWRLTTHYVREVHNSAHVVDSAEARVRGGRSRPADDAPLAEWNLYWESRLKNLQHDLDSLAQEMREADAKNARRLAEEVQRLERLITETREDVRAVAGGKGGGGLIKAWGALVAIGFGAVLQIIGVGIG